MTNMTNSPRAFKVLSMLFVSSFLLSGCAAAIITGAGAVGISAAQERQVGQAIDDKVIQAEIGAQILKADEPLFRKTSVTVVEGRVLITGHLMEEAQVSKAEKIAWTVKGVREVLNEMVVSDANTLKSFAKDSWITTRLLAILVADVDIRDLNYKVETTAGVVYLIGIGQSQDEINRVIAHARNIEGVTKVVNHVILKTDPRRK